jgi:hypothetical protein
MFRKLLLASALAISAACATPAQAVEPLVGAKIGTLGIGADAGVRLNDRFGVRLNGNAFSFSDSREISDIDYDADLDLRTIGLLGDWHPFGGGFFLSGGAYWNGNKADLTGKPNGSVEIGNTTYTAAQAGSLRGDVDFQKFAPYLGLGYYGTLFAGFSLGVEVGALYMGSPKVSLTSNSPLVSASDLEVERRKVEDDIDDLRFYPVLMLGASYRF